ncbi:MlaD family protein [Actinomadura algeriensis]|uniref:Phospholipid/cholesterol/gamma-HCH transport system substrate-binding protein n=1 Tax=Actinomadura algeriensis TaxID=1679523 RepID=A0ABR9K1F5_9ACTN|nr:MCE family protein [Actinomadura algeriensis]MBE1536676.1 phospholipid/cholesterol/gamma-HCH transport system substrate-binding protein [Actinomadura algeriensis]
MRTVDLTPRSRLRFGAIGAAVLAVCLVVSFLSARQTHPGSIHLRAAFGRAGEGLTTHSDVRVRGVTVGQVAGVRLTGDGRAMVTLRIDPGVRVPAAAEVAIVPLSAFGPKYVDLRLGANEGEGPFLDDGGTIARTKDPQELTDVAGPAVDLLAALGPRDVATIMGALGGGLDGRGEELGGLIDDSAKLLDMTAGRTDEIGRIARDGGALAATANAHGDEIGAIADDLNVILPSVTGDPEEFYRLLTGLDESARTLDGILESNPAAPGRIIASVDPAVAALYRHRGSFPDLISSSGSILTQLTGIANIPGPHGTLLSRVTVHVESSTVLCESLPGLCAPVESAVPEDPYANRGGN